MRHHSNFVCQACGLETRSVSRAEHHERNHDGHEVFEFFQPIPTRHANDETTTKEIS